MTGRRALRATDWQDRLLASGLGGDLASGLAAFLTLLTRWQGSVNLLGVIDETTLIRRHVLESLVAVPHLPAAGALLDVGSGNGFPAIPLLLARPSLVGVLLEPRERRWAFLREAVRELRLSAEVRREHLADHRGGEYRAVTVRALAVRRWADDALRVLAAGGVLLRWGKAGEEVPGLVRVVTSPLPDAGRGELSVWRRRST